MNNRRLYIESIPQSWLQRNKIGILFWMGLAVLALILSLTTINLYRETGHSRDVENALCLPGMLERRHGEKLLCTDGDHRWIKDMSEDTSKVK